MLTTQGDVAEGFERVRSAFDENLQSRGDLGGAFAATRDGEVIADLWGGVADRESQQPWERDTVAVIHSGTKGMATFCLLSLFDRGLFELDTPISDLWPGFGANYEETVTVRHVASHTSGLPGIRQPLTMSDLVDIDRMIRLTAQEKPFWTPGEVLSYHSLAFGTLAAGIVKSVDGRSIGTFFADEYASPLGIDAWIGFPSDQASRLAKLSHAPEWPRDKMVGRDPEKSALLTAINDNPRRGVDDYPFNDVDVLRAEIPGAAGVASARAMARLYEVLALGGQIDGRRYLSEQTVEQASVVLASGVDWVIERYWERSFGFVVTQDPPSNPRVVSVGHPGAGGSVHGYWPELGVTFSYVMNEIRLPAFKDGVSIGMDDRAASLLDALYESLG